MSRWLIQQPSIKVLSVSLIRPPLVGGNCNANPVSPDILTSQGTTGGIGRLLVVEGVRVEGYGKSDLCGRRLIVGN